MTKAPDRMLMIDDGRSVIDEIAIVDRRSSIVEKRLCRIYSS